jgi:hypothetical protein
MCLGTVVGTFLPIWENLVLVHVGTCWLMLAFDVLAGWDQDDLDLINVILPRFRVNVRILQRLR